MATARLRSTAMAFTRQRAGNTMGGRAGTSTLRQQGEATGRPQAQKYMCVDGSAGPDYRNWGRDYAAEEWLDAAATAARALCQGQWTGPTTVSWPARLCSQRDGSSRIDTDVEASWEAHAARLKAAEITAVLADMEAICRSTFVRDSAEGGGEERHREQQDEEEEEEEKEQDSIGEQQQ